MRGSSHFHQSINVCLPERSGGFADQGEARKRKGTLLLAHPVSEIERQQDVIRLSLPHESDHVLPILLKGLILLPPELMMSAHMDMCTLISNGLAFANKRILQIVWYTVTPVFFLHR